MAKLEISKTEVAALFSQVREEVLADAFNQWMDEFVNDPAAFESTTASALRHARETNAGEVLSYGQSAAVCLVSYLERVTS